MKGFTLIELIISIAIIAIIASIGIINLFSYRNRQDLSLNTGKIVEVLRNAQNRSISQENGTRWGVHFINVSAPNLDYYELFYGASYALNTIVSTATLPSNITFEVPSVSSTIIFSPITGLPNASTTVKIYLLSNPTTSSTIIISNNGNISF